MRQRLFKKYFFAAAFIVVFSLGIMMMILSFAFSNYIAEEKYSLLRKSCSTVVDYSKSLSSKEYNKSDEENLYLIIENIAFLSDIDMYVTDSKGTIIMCSCEKWGNDKHCEHSGDNISFDEAFDDINGSSERVSTLGIYNTPHYIFASELKDYNNLKLGTVVAASPMSATKKMMSSLMRIYLFSAIFPIALMFLAFYTMTYRLTKPLKLMSDAAKAMARGDFSKRIPVNSDDEIGELSVSFNQMTNSLAQLESMRKSFIANVSHELKTPMTTIGGFIDGIIDGTIEPEKQSYYLEIVSNEVKRLSRMVQSMLSVSKLESGEFVLKPESFNFRELLINVVISQEQRIEQKNLNIIGLDEIYDVTLNADRDLIHQVIYNLVDNAIKFSNDGGDISFSLNVDSKKITFNIANSGKGIPSSELPYVFERFYKVDKSRSANKNSTGLGLYIVKTIIKTHGGSIKVTSRENDKTNFQIVLPLNR